MIRLSSAIASLLISCSAVSAQTPASDPAAPPPATTTAAPVPAVTTTEGATVAQFQKIEDAWSDAVNRKDQYALELVLSPLLVDISARGDITTRNQQLVLTINNEDKTLALEQKVITVRLLGDIAVANGTYTLRHKVNGSEVEEKGVFTHVFERVRNGWLCTNSQRTTLATVANAKSARKQSTAEEPFHIPFFSKGEKPSTTTTPNPQQ
ncbi:MAG TPA: nuclear transport factor 2 family protein [Terracidiphilus sp.]|nr:nuclear transport factor 2 family protein [Terracidiphilus sp.]